MKVVIKEGFDSLEQIKQLFLEYANGLEYSLDFQDFEAEIEHLPYKYAKPDGNLFIAKIKGEAVGCVAYKNLGNGICEMKRLYVKPQYRRFGIGKKLAEICISKATKAGYEQMYLDTLESMILAVNLYRQLGFQEIDAYYNNPLPNVLYMSKKLQK